MKKRLIIRTNKMLTLILLFTSIFLMTSKVSFAQNELVSPQPLVAHAGGSIYGFKYTNSLEALEESYKNGFKLIELDFEWTLDGKPVLIHDWEGMASRLFKSEPRRYNSYEFKNSKVFQNLTLMDIDDLAKWLENKKDVSIVTDAKRDNINFLRYISWNHTNIKKQIVPQVYSFEEYHQAKEIGYENIILTLYKTNSTNEEIAEFARENQLFAVTMPIERGYTDLPMKLKELNVFTYAHTVNDFYIFEDLNKNGVSGIYTDSFHADRFEY